MNWYPDIMQYYKQAETSQDDSGHYQVFEGSWQLVGNCRIERNAFGASVQSNALTKDHNFSIYLPTNVKLPKQGTKIKVARYREEVLVETIECVVLDSDSGYKHQRIWAR